MSEIPVTISPGGRAYFTEGVLAYAGPWVHEELQEDHTHSFVEIAVVTGGGRPAVLGRPPAAQHW